MQSAGETWVLAQHRWATGGHGWARVGTGALPLHGGVRLADGESQSGFVVGAQASTAEELSSYSICHRLPLRAGVFIHTRQSWKRAQKAVFFQTQLTAGWIKMLPLRAQSNLPLHGPAHVTETLSALLIFTGNRFGQTLMITFLA